MLACFERVALARRATYSCDLFGIDDMISGLFGMASTSMTNQANLENTMMTNAFNAQQAGLNRAFSAAEAEKARGFSGSEAEKARSFNAAEANLQRAFASKQAEQAMGFSASEAEKARDYTTAMSNSAYQRQVADMKAAGINPILAAYKGGGASTPGSPSPSGVAGSGSAASGPAASTSQASGSQASGVMPARMENIFASALESARSSKVVQSMGQDLKTKEHTTDLEAAKVGTQQNTTELLRRQQENISADTKLKEALKANADRQQSEVSAFGMRFNPAYWFPPRNPTSAKEAFNSNPLNMMKVDQQ